MDVNAGSQVYLEEFLEQPAAKILLGKMLPIMARAMRLWMVAAFVFDICLAQHENAEILETLEDDEENEEKED